MLTPKRIAPFPHEYAGEAEFRRTWRGSEYHVVTSVAQALAIVTAR